MFFETSDEGCVEGVCDGVESELLLVLGSGEAAGVELGLVVSVVSEAILWATDTTGLETVWMKPSI